MINYKFLFVYIVPMITNKRALEFAVSILKSCKGVA